MPLRATTPNGQAWPRISIVTPSFNQGQFIEETIRSVILQQYPNLEYIIIDGGSTDNSVEIIKKYSRWITYWSSEKDRGQSHAINKGFEVATGDIYNWLNSDDILLEGGLFKVVSALSNGNIDLVYGNRVTIDRESIQKGVLFGPLLITKGMWSRKMVLPQETCFWRKSIHDRAGVLSEDYRTIMDQEFFLRLWQCGTMHNMHEYIASYRDHSSTVSSSDVKLRDKELVIMRDRHGMSKKNGLLVPYINFLTKNFDSLNYRIAQLYALAIGGSRVNRSNGSWKWRQAK